MFPDEYSHSPHFPNRYKENSIFKTSTSKYQRQAQLSNLTSKGHWQRAAEMLLMFDNHIFSGARRHFPALRTDRVGFLTATIVEDLQK